MQCNFPSTFCSYTGIINYSPPTAPSCSAGGPVHLARHPNGQMMAVFISGSDLTTKLYDFYSMNNDTPTGITGTIKGAQIAWNPFGYFSIVYSDNGTIKRIRSVDWGQNWGDSVTIVSGGINPAYAIDEKWKIEYIAIYMTDRWKLYRSDDLGATYNYIADMVTTVTNTSAAGLEVHPGASNELSFIYDDVGTIKKLYSSDQGLNWN